MYKTKIDFLLLNLSYVKRILSLARRTMKGKGNSFSPVVGVVGRTPAHWTPLTPDNTAAEKPWDI